MITTSKPITSETSMLPEVRQTYLGGTDAAAICGLSDYRTAYDVFIDKTCQPGEQAYNEIFEWGHLLEDPISQTYIKRFGGEILSANAFYQDPVFPFLAANTDRICVRDGEKFILECKTVSTGAFAKWSMGVPLAYYCQGQWYMGLLGIKKLTFAILVMDSRKLETFDIEFDQDFFEEIKEICVGFWQNHVSLGIPPDMEAEDYKKIVVLEPQSSVAADVDELIIYQELKDLNEKIKALKAEVEQKQELIQAKIRDKELMALPDGKVLFSWKAYKRESVDKDLLKQQYPEAWKACGRETQSRTFYIK